MKISITVRLMTLSSANECSDKGRVQNVQVDTDQFVSRL